MKNGRFACSVRREFARNTAVISRTLYGFIGQTFQEEAVSVQLLAISLSFAHQLITDGYWLTAFYAYAAANQRRAA